ncbi:FAD-dependent oxidoreductase [Myroides sp. LJL119]
MLTFDVLIIGGGVSGVSCAQILGSAHKKPYVVDKRIGIIMHQRASMLQDAIFYNAYGITQGTLGRELLDQSIKDLETFTNIEQIHLEKVLSVQKKDQYFLVQTNKSSYLAKNIVIAVNSSGSFNIDGLMQYVEPHGKSLSSKGRIQLKNTDHLVDCGIYVCGTLAGHASQLSIAAGSGAMVATDILSLWNEGIPSHSHDSIRTK